MKISKTAQYALIICGICAAAILISTIIATLVKKEDAPASASTSGGTDSLKDHDAPAIAEKDDRHSSKVRRGYIPIQLGRQED